MRIVLCGGGSGGHFYPLIAVAEALETIVEERNLLEPSVTYIGPTPFDEVMLMEHNISYVHAAAGKLDRHRRVPNPLAALKMFFGVVHALLRLFSIYPDVVFSTGGYAAFPTLYAARILNIPVVIYDADATPGKVTTWSAKFARWIGIAHTEAVQHFSKTQQERLANVGHPIRKAIEHPAPEGGHEFLKLDPSVPTIFVLGGSQGSQAINNTLLNALPALLERYNVVHQAGSANVAEIEELISVILKDSRYHNRYRVFGLLNTLALRMAAGISSLVVSRAGSGAIFEIASWGIPSIIIPIPPDVSHDQTENAFSYARSGAATVLEQINLTPHLLIAEIARIMDSPDIQKKMRESAREYARPDAAKKIAKILVETALEHEPK